MNDNQIPKQTLNNWKENIKLPFPFLFIFGPFIFSFAEHFRSWAWDNPVLSIFLYSFWILFGLMIGFLNSILKEIRSTIIGHVAGRLNSVAIRLLKREKRHYLDLILNRHRYLDRKGFPGRIAFRQTLEQAFVELEFVPIAPHHAKRNIVRLESESKLHRRMNLWDYLTSDGMDPPKLVILGPPGSGKTTLLRQTALALALGQNVPRKLTAKRLVPILLFLREWTTEFAKNPNHSLPAILAKDAQKYDTEHGTISADFFHGQLDAGRCLIMFDGIDEIIDRNEQSSVLKWIQAQIETYASNAFIITSRPHGFKGDELRGVDTLQIQPLTSLQVRDFVNRWYQSQKKRTTEEIRTKINQVLSIIAHRHVSPLSRTPLLLSMICMIQEDTDYLPSQIFDLYDRIVDISILGSDRCLNEIQYDIQKKWKIIISHIAWLMMEKGKHSFSTNDSRDRLFIENLLKRNEIDSDINLFFKKIEEKSGLLIEKDSQCYEFAHLSFQEFLSAYLASEDNSKRLTGKIKNDRWHSVIIFYSKKNNADGIVNAIMRQKKQTSSTANLVIRLDEESTLLTDKTRTRLKNFISMCATNPNEDVWSVFLEKILDNRLERLAQNHEKVCTDGELITQGEYMLFLGKALLEGYLGYPDHLARGPIWTRNLEPMLGTRHQDAEQFCNWLTQRDAGEFEYRLPSESELEQVEGNRSVPMSWHHIPESVLAFKILPEETLLTRQKDKASDGYFDELISSSESGFWNNRTMIAYAMSMYQSSFPIYHTATSFSKMKYAINMMHSLFGSNQRHEDPTLKYFGIIFSFCSFLIYIRTTTLMYRIDIFQNLKGDRGYCNSETFFSTLQSLSDAMSNSNEVKSLLNYGFAIHELIEIQKSGKWESKHCIRCSELIVLLIRELLRFLANNFKDEKEKKGKLEQMMPEIFHDVMVFRRRSKTSWKLDGYARMVDIFLAAIYMHNRVGGVEKPFEAIRIVRERKI